MQRDREIVVVDAPELLEDRLGLAAGVDEHQRGLVLLDEAVDFADGVPRRMPGPRQPLGGVEHGDVRRRAVVGDHEIGEHGVWRALRLRHQIAAQIVGLRDRRRQADRGQLRRERKQPRQPEREQIAALRRHQRMQFVEHDAAQRAEQERRVGRGQDQRQLLRRREQDMRRIAALALALRRRRVAGAGLDPDRQLHLGDRRLEIARDVDRERLQRRDVERVQSALAPHLAAGGDELARGLEFRALARCAPLLPFAQRMVGRGRGWGVARPRKDRPPPLTPPRRSQVLAWGGEQTAPAARACSNCELLHSAPPASAEIPPASCRRRSARSAAPSGRRAPSPAVRAGARAVPSRAARTSARTARATSRFRGVRERSPVRSSGGRRRGRGRFRRHHDQPRHRDALLPARRSRRKPDTSKPGLRQCRPDMILAMRVAHRLAQEHARRRRGFRR